MNPLETAGISMTRRNFMKKTILTIGAVTFLAQGIGLALGSSSPPPPELKWETFKRPNGAGVQFVDQGPNAPRENVIAQAVSSLMDSDSAPGPNGQPLITWELLDREYGGSRKARSTEIVDNGQPTVTWENLLQKWAVGWAPEKRIIKKEVYRI